MRKHIHTHLGKILMRFQGSAKASSKEAHSLTVHRLFRNQIDIMKRRIFWAIYYTGIASRELAKTLKHRDGTRYTAQEVEQVYEDMLRDLGREVIKEALEEVG